MSSKVFKIECALKGSYVEFILLDLFDERFMRGWGKYEMQVVDGGPIELEFHWAETMSGRQLFLRQVEPDKWLFQAIFPNGSLQFAWDINSLLAVYMAESVHRGGVGEIKVYRDASLRKTSIS